MTDKTQTACTPRHHFLTNLKYCSKGANTCLFGTLWVSHTMHCQGKKACRMPSPSFRILLHSPCQVKFQDYHDTSFLCFQHFASKTMLWPGLSLRSLPSCPGSGDIKVKEIVKPDEIFSLYDQNSGRQHGARCQIPYRIVCCPRGFIPNRRDRDENGKFLDTVAQNPRQKLLEVKFGPTSGCVKD
jgi:hypothetical protein